MNVGELHSFGTLICALQTCRKKQKLSSAKNVHAFFSKKRLENANFVENYMVPMFMECGSTFDALQTFSSSDHQNEHSWTSLLVGHVECGQSQHAFSLYKRMDEDGIDPSPYTFLALLKACAKLKDADKGRQIHDEISKKGLEQDMFLGSTLVDMYAKCGSLAEARQVFGKLAVKNTVSWTALIAGYAEHGPAQEALRCFEQMQDEGLSADAVTWVCCLKVCGNLGAIEKGREMHIQVAQKGFEGILFVGNALVDMYAKCGSLAEAGDVFDRLPNRDVISWTTLIARYAESALYHELLRCFDQMKLVGIYPNVITFVYSLKACANLRAIDKGRAIHIEIAKMGYEMNAAIGNSLVDMYAKCGSLKEAEKAFNKLQIQDVVSWTALMSGYADNRLYQEVLNCFERMQVHGLSPNATALVLIVGACGSIKAIDKARRIHSNIEDKGLHVDLSIGNALITMYVNCGLLEEAWRVFEKLSNRDIVSWTALIAGYVENGLAHEGLQCFDQMQIEGIFPNVVAYICSLKGCACCGAISKGREIHANVIKQGFSEDLCASNCLIYMYSKCQSLTESIEVFDKMQSRDIVSWNTLIAGCVDNGYCEEVLNFFGQMELECISPNAITYVCTLRACESIGALDKAREIHDKIAEKGLHKDLYVGNALIKVYAKCGSLLEAREVFERMTTKDIVSWNTIISEYAENQCGQEALNCYDEMIIKGITPDAITFLCILKACSSIGAIETGQKIHKELAQKKLNSFVISALIDMYAKCGYLKEAQEVFDASPIRDVVSWNSLIAGYAENAHGEQAVECFEQMQHEGVCPNTVTFLSILKACGSIGAIERGRQMHMEMIQMGLEMDLFIGSTLVDMYAKCGLLKDARKVFSKLPVRSSVSWNAMIRGYGINHAGAMAVQCFEDMQGENVKPDAVTFLCLLTACARTNLVSNGQTYFKIMRMKYGIVPSIDHYACMIDLFARSGQLYEASELIRSVDCSLSREIWLALLSACRTYGEADVGEKCFQHLVEISPENAASYVLMANSFVDSGRWHDASRLELLRKHRGVKRKLGRALIEVDKKIHAFQVGDKQSEEIAAMLEALGSRMKERGYVPDTDLIVQPIPEKEKEQALCGHAEKLAIAFGLLHAPQGHTLHLTKNMRMCNDCHNAFKSISDIERREIVLRESTWVHHFKAGSCSCGDMW